MLKFSILIPVIKGKFLATAIESVLKQTYSDWEMIVYNDCSPDNIDEIIRQYNDSRIKYFKSDKNLGSEDPSKTWNTMLPLASGQYICLLGDDDYISDNYLEEIQKLILRYKNVDIFRVQLKRVNEKNEVIFSGDLLPEHESWGQFLYQRIVKNRVQSTTEFILKKKALLDIGGYVNFPLAWGSDDATYLLLAKNNGIASTNKAYAYWRKSLLNISDNDVQRLSDDDRNLYLLKERELLDGIFSSEVSVHVLYNTIDEKINEPKINSINKKLNYLQNEFNAKQQQILHITNELNAEKYEKNRFQDRSEWLQNEFNLSKKQIAELNQHIGKIEAEFNVNKTKLDSITAECFKKDIAISSLHEKENQQTVNLQSKEQEIIILQNQISGLNIILLQKDNNIVLMQSSKFWKLRHIYLRGKWAILNPLKFTKKYFIKSLPNYFQIKWAVFHPILFLKKHVLKRNKITKRQNNIVVPFFTQQIDQNLTTDELINVSPYTRRIITNLKAAIENRNKKI